MEFALAVTILGLKFSGTQALIVGVIVVLIVVGAWLVIARRRRRKGPT